MTFVRAEEKAVVNRVEIKATWRLNIMSCNAYSASGRERTGTGCTTSLYESLNIPCRCFLQVILIFMCLRCTRLDQYRKLFASTGYVCLAHISFQHCEALYGEERICSRARHCVQRMPSFGQACAFGGCCFHKKIQDSTSSRADSHEVYNLRSKEPSFVQLQGNRYRN